jgi:hypothetical protein
MRPDIRQRIIVLSRDDYNRARMVTPELLADSLTRVVAVPLRPPDSEDPVLLAVGGQLRPHAVLLRNAWGGGAYIDATTAYELMSLTKFNLFANICQMLGAARLEVTELREVTIDGTVSGSAHFRANAADGGGTLNSETSRHLAQSIQGLWVWQSGPTDADAASAYAVAEHIGDDPVVTGLIQQRRFARNALSQHQLELNISSEALRVVRQTLEVESILRRLGPAFDSTFQSLRKQSQQLVLRVRVMFTTP